MSVCARTFVGTIKMSSLLPIIPNYLQRVDLTLFMMEETYDFRQTDRMYSHPGPGSTTLEA